MHMENMPKCVYSLWGEGDTKTLGFSLICRISWQASANFLFVELVHYCPVWGEGGHTQSFHVFSLWVSSKAHWLSAFVCFVSSDPSQWTKEPTMQCLAVPDSLNHDNTKGQLLFWLYKTIPRSCFRKAGAEEKFGVYTLRYIQGNPNMFCPLYISCPVSQVNDFCTGLVH